MKTINFENLGGLPLKQPTLDFMQSGSLETQHAFLQWILNPPVLDVSASVFEGVILVGIEEVTTGGVQTYSPGWIIRDGKLLYFAGATVASVVSGSGIGIQTVTTQATFKDGSVKNVLTYEMAVAGGTDALPPSSYFRAVNLADLRPVLARKYQIEVATLAPGTLQNVSISVPGAKIGDVIVVSVAEVAGVSTTTYGISDWITARGRVTTDGQLTVTLINGHASLPAFDGLVEFKIRILK